MIVATIGAPVSETVDVRSNSDVFSLERKNEVELILKLLQYLLFVFTYNALIFCRNNLRLRFVPLCKERNTAQLVLNSILYGQRDTQVISCYILTFDCSFDNSTVIYRFKLILSKVDLPSSFACFFQESFPYSSGEQRDDAPLAFSLGVMWLA